MDIVFIIAEVTFLILAFLLLNWVVGIIFKQITKLAFFEGKGAKLATLRLNISRIFLFTCGGLTLLTLVGSAVVIYQGKNVQEFQLNLIRTIPSQFWINLVAAIFKSVILLMLVKYIVPPLHRFLDFASDRAQNFDDISANDESIATFFDFLKITLSTTIWLFAAILCTDFFYIPKSVTKYLYIGLRSFIFVAIGLLVIKAISATIDTLDVLARRYSKPDNILRFYERLHHLVLLFKKCLEYVVYVGIATLVVRQIDVLAWTAVYGTKILQIIGVFFLSGVAIEIANTILEDLILRSESLNDLQKQRRLTIIPLFKSILKYLIYFTAGVTILKLIGIDPTPILAGAGILGLAVGFGAQNLINDIVCGFFILFENYYLVGDFIEVGQASGFVESIDLRSTRIRHPNGQVYIMRNGEVKDIINFSKQYIYAVVEVGVSYESDLDLVYEVLEGLGKELKENYSEVLEPTLVEGVEKFGESELVIRTITKVKPGKHYRIERMLRKAIKYAFDREGIAFSDSDNLVIMNHSDKSQ